MFQMTAFCAVARTRACAGADQGGDRPISVSYGIPPGPSVSALSTFRSSPTQVDPANRGLATRQRVAIGRPIRHRPDGFRFGKLPPDLDAEPRVTTGGEAANHHLRLAVARIHVTQRVAVMMTLADRLVPLSAAQIARQGRTLDLCHDPANRFIAGFPGNPGRNVLSARIVHIQKDGLRIMAKDATDPSSSKQRTRLCSPVSTPKQASGPLSTVVEDAEPRGSGCRVHVKTGTGDRMIVALDEDASVSISPDKTIDTDFFAKDAQLRCAEGQRLRWINRFLSDHPRNTRAYPEDPCINPKLCAPFEAGRCP